MPLRAHTFCAVVALAVGLSACAGPSEPGRTAAKLVDKTSHASTADALARIAQKSLDAGDPVSAASMLKRAHEIDPDSAAILAELGRTLGSLDGRTEAAEAYRKAAALAPNDAAIRRGYAGALLALNQPELAEQEYRAAISVRSDAASLCGLGVTLDLQGRHDEAEAAFRKAYQIDPESQATRANLALSLALWGKSDEAIGLLAPMAAAPDAKARQRQNLALVFGLAGELDQAAAIARIDLGDEAVRSNLAYYETLKALPPVLRVRAIMGAHNAEPPLPPHKPESMADTAVAPEPSLPPAQAPTAAPEPRQSVPPKPSRTAERAAPVARSVQAKSVEPPERPAAVVENAEVTTHIIVTPRPDVAAPPPTEDAPPHSAPAVETAAEKPIALLPEAKPAGVDPAPGFVAATAATAVGDPAAPSDTTP
jgi:Flp pilus assembly protein TadD